MGLHILQEQVNKVYTDRASFDSSRPCTICGKPGHSFEKCEELQDYDKLRQAFIRLSIVTKRFAKQANSPNIRL